MIFIFHKVKSQCNCSWITIVRKRKSHVWLWNCFVNCKSIWQNVIILCLHICVSIYSKCFSAIDDYESNSDSIIILNPSGYEQILKNLNKEDITSFYIYSNIKTIKNRLKKRGDKKEEAERRIEADLADFKGLEYKVDHIVYNNDRTKDFMKKTKKEVINNWDTLQQNIRANIV